MSELAALRMSPAWEPAMERLRARYEEHGAAAERNAATYADIYRGARAAMVLDVVLSRQRRYVERVLPLVQRFRDVRGDVSLAELASDGPGDGLPLRVGEVETVREMASGLSRYCVERGLDDEGVGAWATEADLGVAFRVDAYVGAVKGVGIALFHYLRMRCGADTLKPDRRVRTALRGAGLPLLRATDEAVYVVACAAAVDLGVARLVLDQVLW